MFCCRCEYPSSVTAQELSSKKKQVLAVHEMIWSVGRIIDHNG